VSEPSEVPERPEVAIDSTGLGADEAVQQILLKLEHEGHSALTDKTGARNVPQAVDRRISPT
jgi:hypothetical protein